jgi:hypothetical protein
MTMTNALAYYDTVITTVFKSFIEQAPGVDLIKRFWDKCTHSFFVIHSVFLSVVHQPVK